MSFRIEEKLLIDKSQLIEFKEYLFKKAKPIHKPRIVKSLYFENTNKEMYNDSIEGLLPRKKIRVRNYPETSDKAFYLENKISSVEGRFKTSKEINEKHFSEIKNLGIYDTQYGVCFPFLEVMYRREYYQVDDFRVSIDEDIKYNLYNGRDLGQDQNCIAEIKANFNKNHDQLISKFHLQRTRFSKYCNGFDKI